MDQVAMRAPGRGHSSISIGTPDGGVPIKYSVDSYGVANVHVSHEAAVRALGFTRCEDEKPEAPPVASLSAEDWAGAQEYMKLKAQAEAKAKATESAESAEKTRTENAQRSAQAAASVKAK